MERGYEDTSIWERYIPSEPPMWGGGEQRTNLRDARAGDVMTTRVATVHPDDAVQYAAWLMGDCDCGALPVVDGDRRLIGMVTDRDIVVRILARGFDPRRARVEDCFTAERFACHYDDRLQECMRQMARHQIRRLPIVDGRGRIVGIVTQADLARHAGRYPGEGERRALGNTLRDISEPTHRPYR